MDDLIEFTENKTEEREVYRGVYAVELIDPLDAGADLQLHSRFDGGLTRLRHRFEASSDPAAGERSFAIARYFDLKLTGQTTFPFRVKIWKVRGC